MNPLEKLTTEYQPLKRIAVSGGDPPELWLIRWPETTSQNAYWVEVRPGRGFTPIGGPYPWQEAPQQPPAVSVLERILEATKTAGPPFLALHRIRDLVLKELGRSDPTLFTLSPLPGNPYVCRDCGASYEPSTFDGKVEVPGGTCGVDCKGRPGSMDPQHDPQHGHLKALQKRIARKPPKRRKQPG